MSHVGIPGRILVVDDNTNAVKALQYVLDREGFRTDSADSGAEALDRLAKNGYQVLISDLRMPGMTGVELLRKVRDAYPDIPVLILTAHGSVDAAVQAHAPATIRQSVNGHSRTHNHHASASTSAGTSPHTGSDTPPIRCA